MFHAQELFVILFLKVTTLHAIMKTGNNLNIQQ